MKKLPPRTKWFPASVKPKHVGWYECLYEGDDDPERRFWNGSFWSKGITECAFGWVGYKDKWRGLTKPV